MRKCADLEITLNRDEGGNFSASLRCTLPGDDVDVSRSGTAQFDFQQLRGLSLETMQYASLLTNSLFKDPAVASAFAEARSAAQALEAGLRIHLSINSNAPDLHGLRWETLLDPRDGSFLFAGEQVLLSRYLGSLDWQPVRLRPQTQLKALAVIANPANLAQYHLMPVDVRAELSRAQASMSGIGLTTLASAGTATLNNLADHLREGGHDILYLVCHGSMVEGEPWLWMEDEAGNVARVRGADLVACLKQLEQRPRLVVLASCRSAGRADDGNPGAAGALVALGPRLAGAGIPAVLAMQGSVSMETVSRFMPVFFRELLRDGQIDRAMAVARGSVSDRPDFWMPVLFMRLKSGRIWDDAANAPPMAAAAAASGQGPTFALPKSKPVDHPANVGAVPDPSHQTRAAPEPSQKPALLRWALALLLVAAAAAGWWIKMRTTPQASPVQQTTGKEVQQQQAAGTDTKQPQVAGDNGKPGSDGASGAGTNEVKPPPIAKPAIQALSVIPSHVRKGQKVTISWNVDNADEVELSHIGPVNTSGTMSFEPTESTVFNLVAKNSAGTDARQAQVVVLADTQSVGTGQSDTVVTRPNKSSVGASPNLAGNWAEIPPYLDPEHPGKMVINQESSQVRFSGNFCGSRQHGAGMPHPLTSSGIEWKTFHAIGGQEVQTEAEADWIDTFEWKWDGSVLSCQALYYYKRAVGNSPAGTTKSAVRRYQKVADATSQ